MRNVTHGCSAYRRNIVDDGECSEEDFQPERDSVAEKRHDTDDEGDVSGHRYPPASGSRTAEV